MLIVHVHCSLFMFIVHCSHGATLIFDDVFFVFSVNLTISINWLWLTASINVKLSKRIACALCREFMESVFHLLKINDTLNKQSK